MGHGNTPDMQNWKQVQAFVLDQNSKFCHKRDSLFPINCFLSRSCGIEQKSLISGNKLSSSTVIMIKIQNEWNLAHKIKFWLALFDEKQNFPINIYKFLDVLSQRCLQFSKHIFGYETNFSSYPYDKSNYTIGLYFTQAK